jgi:hypothetical protein
VLLDLRFGARFRAGLPNALGLRFLETMVLVQARENAKEDGLRHNRRRKPRIALELPVEFQFVDGAIRAGKTLDYSELGVFVATFTIPPLGSWGVLRLDVSGELFNVEALVVRVVPLHTTGLRSGFGAEFVALPRAAKASIVRLLGAAASKGL